MSSVLTQADFVVKRRPQVFEVRSGYDIYDAGSASAVGSVEQVGRDNMEKLARPQRADNAKTFLEVRDASGAASANAWAAVASAAGSPNIADWKPA